VRNPQAGGAATCHRYRFRLKSPGSRVSRAGMPCRARFQLDCRPSGRAMPRCSGKPWRPRNCGGRREAWRQSVSRSDLVAGMVPPPLLHWRVFGPDRSEPAGRVWSALAAGSHATIASSTQRHQVGPAPRAAGAVGGVRRNNQPSAINWRRLLWRSRTPTSSQSCASGGAP